MLTDDGNHQPYGPLRKAVLLQTHVGQTRQAATGSPLPPHGGWDLTWTPAVGTVLTGSQCASAQTPGGKTGSATGVLQQRTKHFMNFKKPFLMKDQ